MPLNPLLDARRNALRDDPAPATPFRAESEAALAGFRALRGALQRQVRQGELTPQVARRRAAEAAAAVRRDLLARSEGYSPTPPLFLERLTLAAESRTAARAGQSLEALQRETNRLLRQSLIEQQLVNRAAEFEGRAYRRPLTGGQPAPTLDGLLEFHETAERSGDDAAREWARRGLEGLRSRLIDPDDLIRIDTACDRPDLVNPRVVARYVEALRGVPGEEIETFAIRALEAHDAGACCAAYVLARESPEGPISPCVRTVLEGLGDFPDAALEHLRAWEAEARRDDAASARALAERTAAIAAAEARLPGLEAPEPVELERRSRIAARPVADPGEPIGLAPVRRGLDPAMFAAMQDRSASETAASAAEGDGVVAG